MTKLEKQLALLVSKTGAARGDGGGRRKGADGERGGPVGGRGAAGDGSGEHGNHLTSGDRTN